MSSKLGTFKGHPTISLGEGEYPFSFGLSKAKLILEHLEDIRAFVDRAQGAPKGRANDQDVAQALAVRGITISRTLAEAPARIPVTPGNPPSAHPLVNGHNVNEDTLRSELICRGCGKPKGMEGLLVCWDCFKRHPQNPLATSGLSVGEWLAQYGRKAGAL